MENTMSSTTFNVFGKHPEDVIQQLKVSAKQAEFATLCDDGHLGYSQPIGSAIAFKDKVSVSGVGYDIGCGNTALKLSTSFDAIKNEIPAIADYIAETFSFGVGGVSNLAEKFSEGIFDEPIWDEIDILKELKPKAIQQFGTIGSGNHYVDVFKDTCDSIWLGCHFGSRGLGHGIASHFLKKMGAKDSIHAEAAILDTDSQWGKEYLTCMRLAARYANFGRFAVLNIIKEALGADIEKVVQNNHNYAFQEHHFGQSYYVVRKGCTPLFPTMLSFIGGSMGDKSYIIEGLSSIENKSSLFSTIHGAGRNLSRSQAKKTFSKEDMDAWLEQSKITLRGGDLDESPMAYKRIEEVLDIHTKANTCRIYATLHPIIVCMAGNHSYDYKGEYSFV